MKIINFKTLTLSVALLSTTAILIGTENAAYAASDKKDDSGSKKGDSGNSDSGSKKGDSGNSDSSSNKSDSDARGSSNESKKLTICHVPPGNSANKHTIHIAFSAWPAHKNNHGGDYLGSCNNPSIAAASQNSVANSSGNLVVIKNCTGSYRTTLLALTQSYFEPVVVSDTALDDETVATAVSSCLNKGDSSDSGQGDSSKRGVSVSNQQGGALDIRSDSGHHHIIRGCKNKGTGNSSDSERANRSDSNNHHASLKQAVENYNTNHHVTPTLTLVTDSSLNDSGSNNHYSSNVYTAYRSCVSDSSDTSKVKKNFGDSGHKYRQVKNCANDATIRSAIDAHHKKAQDNSIAKYNNRPIILNQSSLTDTVIQTAVNDCIDPNKGRGSQSSLTADPNNAQGVSDTGYSGRLNQLERNTVKPSN